MVFPECLPTNSLERQLHIVKLLHDPEKNKRSAIPGMLYVSDKTIENDLKKLQGEDGDPLEVLGQKLVIDFDRQSRHFSSTVHPLFLTFNLTQVITTLEGLKKMSEDSAHKKLCPQCSKDNLGSTIRLCHAENIHSFRRSWFRCQLVSVFRPRREKSVLLRDDVLNRSWV